VLASPPLIAPLLANAPRAAVYCLPRSAAPALSAVNLSCRPAPAKSPNILPRVAATLASCEPKVPEAANCCNCAAPGANA